MQTARNGLDAPRGETSRATLMVLAAALLWSSGGIGVKATTGPALAVAGWRAVFALPVLIAAAILEARRRRVARPWALLGRPLVWGAAASYATMVVFYVVSMRYTTAANAILIQYTGPVYVALLSWPLLREPVRRIDWIATAGCVLGMVLFFMDEIDARGMLGNAFATLSSMGFAGVPLLMRLELRRRAAKGDQASPDPLVALAPYVSMALGNAIAMVACAPVMATTALDPRTFEVVAALGTLQIGAAYWLYGGAVGRLSAVRSTLLACIEPVLNPLWVLLVHGERPSRWALAGGAIIVGAVASQGLARRGVDSRA